MGKYREVNEELIKLVQEKKTGKEISRILNLDYTTVHDKLRKLGLHLPNYHNSLKFDNTVFDVIDTEEKAYWLGFLYADGSVHSNNNSIELSLKGDDINHLYKYKEFLKGQAPVKTGNISYNGKIYTRCRYIVSNKYFKQRLIQLGCVPRKSLILKFPDINIFENKELVYDFIRGYVDGDGCLTFTKTGRLTIEIIGTLNFLEGIKNIFPQFKKYCKDKRTGVYFLSCSCNYADEVATKLYKDSTIFLDRKYNRFCRTVQK